MSPNTPKIPTATTATVTGPTLLSLSSLAPRDEPPLRLYLAAVQTLIQWQLDAPAFERPQTNADADAMLMSLQGFNQWYLARYRQCTLDAMQHKTLQSAFTELVRQVQDLPMVNVHGNFNPDQLVLASYPEPTFAIPATESNRSGPVGCDIAALTRDPRLLWDEAFTLDVTIRYWDLARKAELPVGADFGTFYRGLEWTALARHLSALGELARHAVQSASTPDEETMTLAPALVALILTTCNRYIELKPLLRLIERIEGMEAPSGFVFGKI
jgi:aminoglycoside/choline kinase family phosphotransferase